VTIRVLIADDHAIVRQGLCRVLTMVEDIEVQGEVSDGSQLLERLNHEKFDLIVLDMSMPGPTGLDLIGKLNNLWPDTPVLVFSMYGESHLAANAIRAGAKGYITKDSDPEIIISAIRHCATGRHYLHPSLGAQLMFDQKLAATQDPHLRLSARENQVFLMLANGLHVSEIGQKLHISPKTVSTHKFRIMQKLSMKSISDLVRYAVRHELIES